MNEPIGRQQNKHLRMIAESIGMKVGKGALGGDDLSDLEPLWWRGMGEVWRVRGG